MGRMKRVVSAASRIRISQLLIFSAGFHLAITVAVFLVGKLSLLPSQFDTNGFGKFAADNYLYQIDIALLTDELGQLGIMAWLNATAPLHVKLYSISHILVGHWTGLNILTIEPLNLFYYVAILFLVYKLSQMIFDRRTAMLATIIVGLWPSFLLHTTQLLRDPLLIVAILVFLLIITSWLTRDYSYRLSAWIFVAGGLAVFTIWTVRLPMWEVVRVVALAGIVLLFVRLLREKRILIGNLVNAVLLVGLILVIPQFKPLPGLQQSQAPDQVKQKVVEDVEGKPIWERAALRRRGFAYLRNDALSASASNIDEDVEFNTRADLIRYIPRAAVIGFFAPFPNMWFARGSQVGSMGRKLAGIETFFIYVLELFGLVAVWQKRKALAVWLMVITVAVGVIAVSLIVLNVGALYRVRYPYWILIVLLGAGGVVRIIGRRRSHMVPG